MIEQDYQWNALLYCDICEQEEHCEMSSHNGTIIGYCLTCQSPVDQDTIYDGYEGTELETELTW